MVVLGAHGAAAEMVLNYLGGLHERSSRRGWRVWVIVEACGRVPPAGPVWIVPLWPLLLGCAPKKRTTKINVHSTYFWCEYGLREGCIER